MRTCFFLFSVWFIWKKINASLCMYAHIWSIFLKSHVRSEIHYNRDHYQHAFAGLKNFYYVKKVIGWTPIPPWILATVMAHYKMANRVSEYCSSPQGTGGSKWPHTSSRARKKSILKSKGEIIFRYKKYRMQNWIAFGCIMP